MKPLDQAFAHDWTWNRPHVGRRHWELLSGGECFATIEARSLLGSRMAAVTSAGEREIRHEGWFRGRIRMTDGAGATIATFEPSWFGSGRIVFPGTLELKWTRVDFWGRRWAFRDADGHDQVVFARKPSWFRSTTHVEVSDAGRRRPELADLVLAGFYLLLLMQRQAHAAH